MTKKTNQLENKLKRALADYDNLCKRVEREKTNLVRFTSADLIDKLLSVLDDLERVERYSKDKGLRLAVDRFRQVLFTEGMEEIETKGKKFDAHLMDCLEVVKGPKNRVIEVTTKGYYLHGRVLRPAQVKVGGLS